jgi:hypothetical protein
MFITISMVTREVMPARDELDARAAVERELSLPSGSIGGHDAGEHQMCIFLDGVNEGDAAAVAQSCVHSLARRNLLAGARLVFKDDVPVFDVSIGMGMGAA